MYDFVDRRVATLDTGGRFLVWSMRTWVLAMGRRRCPVGAIGPAFLKWGMEQALPDFHMAMMILNRESQLMLHFAPAGCSTVSEDEALLLHLFRSVQMDSANSVKETLALLVEKESVQALLTALARVAVRLGIAGLVPVVPAQRNRIEGNTD